MNKTMNNIFMRGGFRAAALGLLALLILCSCSVSGTVEEPERVRVLKEAPSNQVEVLSGSNNGIAEEPEYIGVLKEVLTNQREFRFIDANASSSEANPGLAEYNSEVHMTLLRDINRQISSIALPEITPVRMTVLDMDMDGTVEVVLSLDPDYGRYGYLILHWEDGEVYGYYRWYRAFKGLSEDGILVSGGTIAGYVPPDTPGALEAARKEYYDHYFYYFEFNGPSFATHDIGYYENPYSPPEVVWSGFTPENIELLVTHSAAETVLQYPRDVFTRDGNEEKE